MSARLQASPPPGAQGQPCFLAHSIDGSQEAAGRKGRGTEPWERKLPSLQRPDVPVFGQNQK